MQKITPFLWFDDQAEDAAKFYVSVFKNSKMGEVNRYPEGTPGTPGSVMTASFTLDGVDFVALNGGPEFTFTEAVSFVINCFGQEEVDYYWNKLTTDGGQESQCGWLKDKFGVSWQVVPEELSGLVGGPDPEGAKRAASAMMQMKKLDVAALQKAYDNKE